MRRWFGFMMLLGVAGGAQGAPDLFEGAPYNDSTRSGSANAVSLASPQDHTLDTATDEDWGIVLETDELIRLELTEALVPEGTVLVLDVETADALPLGTTVLRQGDTGGFVEWRGSGSLAFFRVRLCGAASGEGECLAVTNSIAQGAYRITYATASASEAVTAGQLANGDLAVPLRFPNQEYVDQSLGLNIYRTVVDAQGRSTGEVRLNGAPIPVPCVVACPPGLSAAACSEYRDTAVPRGSAFLLVSYRVERVPLEGAPEGLERSPSNGYIEDQISVRQPICPDPTPSATASPTAGPSATPSPSISPSATATMTPTPPSQRAVALALLVAGGSQSADWNADTARDCADVVAAGLR